MRSTLLSTCLLAILVCFSITTSYAQQVITITGQISGSGGVSVAPDGRIYVGDYGDYINLATGSIVNRLDHNFNVTTFATGLQGASGNTFNSQGEFIQANISGGGSVSKIDTSTGAVTLFASNGIDAPVGVVTDQNDNVYVCNCGDNTIQKITSSGSVSLYSSGPLFLCPNGIAITPNGELYVTNYSNMNVVKIDTSGTPTLFATMPSLRTGHITYSNGNFFIASQGSSQIFKLQLDGTLSNLAGNGVRGNQDGTWSTSTFSLPNGIDASATGDTLFVNCSVSTIWDTPALTLNPSIVRMITGVLIHVGDDGIERAPISLQLHLFPNPASERISINLSSTETQKMDLYLLDGSGKLIQELSESVEINRNGKTIELDLRSLSLSSGNYFISMVGEQSSLTKALIIH